MLNPLLHILQINILWILQGFKLGNTFINAYINAI